VHAPIQNLVVQSRLKPAISWLHRRAPEVWTSESPKLLRTDKRPPHRLTQTKQPMTSSLQARSGSRRSRLHVYRHRLAGVISNGLQDGPPIRAKGHSAMENGIAICLERTGKAE